MASTEREHNNGSGPSGEEPPVGSSVQEQSPLSGSQEGFTPSPGSWKASAFRHPKETANSLIFCTLKTQKVTTISSVFPQLSGQSSTDRTCCRELIGLMRLYICVCMAVGLLCYQACYRNPRISIADRNKSSDSAENEMFGCIKTVWRHSQVLAKRLILDVQVAVAYNSGYIIPQSAKELFNGVSDPQFGQ